MQKPRIVNGSIQHSSHQDTAEPRPYTTPFDSVLPEKRRDCAQGDTSVRRSRLMSRTTCAVMEGRECELAAVRLTMLN